MKKILMLLLIAICWGCSHSSKTEKYQNKRNEIINVHERVKELNTGDVLIGSYAGIYLMDDYLIIGDYRSNDRLIHVFNKHDYSYLTSAVRQGEGPGEITIMGHIGIDESNRTLYISDHGKQTIFSYNLDSIFVNSSYMPTVKMKMNAKQFPDRYQYVNDTLSIGLIIEPIGNSDFKQTIAKWNMKTGKIVPMAYTHPNIEKKRICFASSIEYGIYVECYNYNDLMSICSLDGKLKCNVYGPNWDKQIANKVSYFGPVAFCGDKILALYSGEDTFSKDRNKGIRTNNPTKFLVFDIEGNYIKTLETGYMIKNFCYDKDTNRLIMDMDDVIQFGYLDLDEII